MAIRRGRVDDIPAFEYLDKLCFPQTIRYSRFDFIYYFFKKNVFTLVSEKDRQLNAFLIADLKSATEGHIISIDVHPDLRRSGLGRKLMAEAEKIFTDMGIEHVILEVHESNVIAQMFYSELGYKMKQKLNKYYHSGHGMQMVKDIMPIPVEVPEAKVIRTSTEPVSSDPRQKTLASFELSN